MDGALEEFRAKFRVADLLVVESSFWTWSVRPAQPTLGAGIVALKRPAPRLSAVAAEEMADLAEVVRQVEARLARCFHHQIMNYLMLMMVDHQVHYHALPRYDSPREFAGRRWLDTGWPALPSFGEAQHADAPEALFAIRDTLRGKPPQE
jgi:diadenosine tetraphosphate (Ap4A) HIT family hydrolase